jgi:predicted regulator of Ras-like GTPase activity (Roadblock/LC7/MglB family)
MASRTEEIVRHLKTLQMNTPDIEASAVVSVEGLLMAATLPADVAEDRVAALSAAMHSLGKHLASALKRGALDQVFVRGEEGYVVLVSIGEKAVLTALALSRAKLGLVFLEMKRTANELVSLV